MKENKDKQTYKQLSSALFEFKNNENNAAHLVAYNKAPFLVPVNLLKAVTYTIPSTECEHLNVWERPYKIQFQSADIQQFRIEINDK
ncbi:hypothetical protein HDR66_00300 [bacterium]|nr:hypothetical protein [bacterium]